MPANPPVIAINDSDRAVFNDVQEIAARSIAKAGGYGAKAWKYFLLEATPVITTNTIAPTTLMMMVSQVTTLNQLNTLNPSAYWMSVHMVLIGFTALTTLQLILKRYQERYNHLPENLKKVIDGLDCFFSASGTQGFTLLFLSQILGYVFPQGFANYTPPVIALLAAVVAVPTIIAIMTEYFGLKNLREVLDEDYQYIAEKIRTTGQKINLLFWDALSTFMTGASIPGGIIGFMMALSSAGKIDNQDFNNDINSQETVNITFGLTLAVGVAYMCLRTVPFARLLFHKHDAQKPNDENEAAAARKFDMVKNRATFVDPVVQTFVCWSYLYQMYVFAALTSNSAQSLARISAATVALSSAGTLAIWSTPQCSSPERAAESEGYEAVARTETTAATASDDDLLEQGYREVSASSYER